MNNMEIIHQCYDMIKTQKLRELAILEQKIEPISEKGDKAMAPIIKQLPSDNIFGKEKREHIKKLADESEEIAKSEGLSAIETLLLKPILEFHDIGRARGGFNEFTHLKARKETWVLKC